MQICEFLPIYPIFNLNISDIEKANNDINTIDLSRVKSKLMDENEGQGWSREHADFVERRYRRYLCMVRLVPDGGWVPTKDIDCFWHQHILDTRAYAADCHKVFGEFLHHFPYFGLRGEEDARNLLSNFEQTKSFYARIFGEDYCLTNMLDSSNGCKNDPKNCRTSCQSSCRTCKTCTTCKNY